MWMIGMDCIVGKGIGNQLYCISWAKLRQIWKIGWEGAEKAKNA